MTLEPRRSQPWSRPANRLLAGGAEIRAGEGRTVLAAGLLLFILLTALMVLRPVREALGLARGIENVRRLFLVTVASTLVLTPLFGWMASRLRRRTLLAISFRICALILLGFFLGLTWLPEYLRTLVASGYYVFHSVFNLLVVSLFWAFMADHFSLAESKRLFPAIALGGSLGAILGSLVSWQLAQRIGISSLFPLAALLLELGVWSATAFDRTRSAGHDQPDDRRPIGGPSLDGMRAVVYSPYIRGIGLFVMFTGVVSTFLYFAGLRLVAAATNSPEQQTALFAHINLWMQLTTLAAQAFVTARIMRVAGVGSALAFLPGLAVCGAAVLALAPALAVYTIVNALFRAAQQGISGPAQETLFTVVDRQHKYKAKSFLDTFGYRAGDASGAYLDRVLAALGAGLLPLTSAVFGVAVIWLALCVYLGRAQNRLANPGELRTTDESSRL